ncbi:hypothetical protein OG937_28395 [Streptomyces sp. NBC_00510]
MAAARLSTVVSVAVAVLLGIFLLLVVVKLPWNGDLGVHAATLQRLSHSPGDPGNPMVDSDTTSPYYSPWMLLLGLLAEVTGWPVFGVLRIAALIALPLLISGIWRFARSLARPGGVALAGPLAVLCILLLWGTTEFSWSGFVGLSSLSLTCSYPSTFALGCAFHLWAWLHRQLGSGRVLTWTAALAMGLLWAVTLLNHQFTGVIATLGVLALLGGARPWPARSVWLRLGTGALCGVTLLALWPYYDFFALAGVGGLEAIHEPLYHRLTVRFGLVLLGVAALALRARRDLRDPLVLFFLSGAAVFAAGGLTGHYSWGRALPAALIPAQLAAALEAAGAGRRSVARGFALLVAAALLVGAWAQRGALGYVVPPRLLPGPVAEAYRTPWPGYAWATDRMNWGDVVMARERPGRQLPAYGPYTVAPGYPDFFLPDQRRRLADTARFYSPATSRQQQERILTRWKVRWVLLDRGDPAPPRGLLSLVAEGNDGQRLYRVHAQ